jgi:hypothetical protein
MTIAADLFFSRIDAEHLAIFGNQYVPNGLAPLYLVERRTDGRQYGYVQLQPESGQWYAWKLDGSFWVSFGTTRNAAGVGLADSEDHLFVPVQGRA